MTPPKKTQSAHYPSLSQSKQQLQQIVVINDGKNRVVFLEEPSYKIGRAPFNEIILNHDVVSRHHATLERTAPSGQEDVAQYRIIDGDMEGKPSKNGLFINKKLCSSHNLKHGDVFSFGQVVQGIYLELSMDDQSFADLLTALNASPAELGIESYAELLDLLESYSHNTSYLSMVDPTSIMLNGTWPER